MRAKTGSIAVFCVARNAKTGDRTVTIMRITG